MLKEMKKYLFVSGINVIWTISRHSVSGREYDVHSVATGIVEFC